MRPQRALAASTMAASDASRVTSASNARHSLPHSAPPPDRRAIATVSSAEAMRLSTAITLAPSCAKRSTVARPLPMPSPGDCPAPTTMATLSLRRMTNLTEKKATIPYPARRGLVRLMRCASRLPQRPLQRRRRHVEGGVAGPHDPAVADKAVHLIGEVQVRHPHAAPLEPARIGDALVEERVVRAGENERGRGAGEVGRVQRRGAPIDLVARVA